MSGWARRREERQQEVGGLHTLEHSSRSTAAVLASIDTDLITPLAAYVRLRSRGAASFLLESVDQGRLGRHSFVGCGTRLVSLAEAETVDAPVVGYVGYDYVARLEPTVALPEDGPDGCPRAASSWPTSSCASTT